MNSEKEKLRKFNTLVIYTSSFTEQQNPFIFCYQSKSLQQITLMLSIARPDNGFQIISTFFLNIPKKYYSLLPTPFQF